MKLAVVLSLVASVGCASIALAGTPTKIWEESSPWVAGNVYYGDVVNDVYYAGQIDSGVLSYTAAQTAGTALVNSYQYGVAAGTKSATKIGDSVYFGGVASATDSIKRLDSWNAVTTMTTSTGAPDAIVTDGTYIYANEYPSGNRNIVRRYSISGANLTADWSIATGATRIRGVSYYNGKVYAADGTNGIYELNASDGSNATKIISWSGRTGYHAARSGNTIFATGDNGSLYQYTLSGGTWNLTDTTDLGMGALYGIGVNSAGTGLWVSAANNKVAYFSTGAPVPEPSSILAMASGLIGLVGFGIRRKIA